MTTNKEPGRSCSPELLNALKVVGKEIGQVRIAMIGMGAANVPTYRFLVSSGADPAKILACRFGRAVGGIGVNVDQRGLSRAMADLSGNQSDRTPGRDCGSLARSRRLRCFSARGIIKPAWVAKMAEDAIVFACANPVPEIWPWEAKEAGARIVATGRSDFPNQVNNSLVFLEFSAACWMCARGPSQQDGDGRSSGIGPLRPRARPSRRLHPSDDG
ncbi:MAG: hypothetical protein U0361_19645 [Nitrospiraceae bacterium]